MQVSASSEEEEMPFAHLPKLPSDCKARYVLHENLCFDWGTFGWALFNLNLDIKAYRHFIFLNTSIRGPFLPSYWPVSCADPSPSLESCERLDVTDCT